MLLAMTSRFRELKLQHKEYLCVKAMILLNSSEYVLGSNTAPFLLRVAGKSASKNPKYQILKNCWKRIIRMDLSLVDCKDFCSGNFQAV